MPLRRLDSRTAWGNTSRNVTRWPALGSARAFPFAAPRLEPSFRIRPGERVFTMGSCFARNIESQLHSLGFIVPGYDRFRGTDFINKYNVFSMLNEIRWAMGEAPFPAFEDRFLAIGKDRYIDPYLHTDPAGWESCREMALKAHELFKLIPECGIFIITLGLVEAWWDLKNRCYLNQTFRLERHVQDNEDLRNTFHDRFEFHQLSYGEVKAGLEEVLAAIRRHALPDCRFLITVSPVPLITTFTEHDPLVANTYSKNLLRVVAEEAACEHDDVDYLPTYESITLAQDPSMVWEKDFIHVRPEAVRFNLERMVEAYVDVPGTAPAQAAPQETNPFHEAWYFQRAAHNIPISNDWIAEFLRRKAPSTSVALYGTGLRGRDLVERHGDALARHRVQFVTTEADGAESFMGHPKHPVGSLAENPPDVVILLSNPYEEEMLANLTFMPRAQVFTLSEVALAAARTSSVYRLLAEPFNLPQAKG